MSSCAAPSRCRADQRGRRRADPRRDFRRRRRAGGPLPVPAIARDRSAPAQPDARTPSDESRGSSRGSTGDGRGRRHSANAIRRTSWLAAACRVVERSRGTRTRVLINDRADKSRGRRDGAPACRWSRRGPRGVSPAGMDDGAVGTVSKASPRTRRRTGLRHAVSEPFLGPADAPTQESRVWPRRCADGPASAGVGGITPARGGLRSVVPRASRHGLFSPRAAPPCS